MNTNIWIPQNFNYTDLTIFRFWWIFLFLEDWRLNGGFVVKHVAAKVIRQHMFFFTLSYFLDNNLWKKDTVVLVNEYHDKWLNVTPVQHFCIAFDHANLVSSFRGSKYLPKLYSVMCIFRIVQKNENIFAYNRKIGNRTHIPNWRKI